MPKNPLDPEDFLFKHEYHGVGDEYKNSYDALWNKEEGKDKHPSQQIVVTDYIKETQDTFIFIWHRHKSNLNITDCGEGKGYSFYRARLAIYDPCAVRLDCGLNQF